MLQPAEPCGPGLSQTLLHEFYPDTDSANIYVYVCVCFSPKSTSVSICQVLGT